jgi:outer membrane receptor protein involved in Fe transport
VLYERSKRKDEGDASLGVPPSLPPELKRGTPPPRAPEAPEPTIEDATNPTITSVSGRAEPLRAAPGKVLVLTGRELRDRGYTELSQIFDDLPGMEVVRPYGDTFFKVYWRGARTTSGLDPYLVTLDGLVFNHLFFRNTQILSTFPLTSIERIEIVYNPATAAALPGSALGAINIVTKDGKARQEHKELGTWLSSRQTFGTHQSNLFQWEDSTKQIDASLMHVARDYRLTLSARVETSAFERAAGERYEYTRDKYYGDARLWPDTVTYRHPGLAGRFFSPIDKRAIDGRLYFGNAEAGVQFSSLSTGLGTRYPGDARQSATPWTTEELSFYGRHVATLASDATLTSLVQYRESDLADPSVLLIGGRALANLNAPALQARLSQPLEFRVPISAILLQEDLSVGIGRGLLADDDVVTVGAGVRFQRQQIGGDPAAISAVVLSMYPSLNPQDPTQNTNLIAAAQSARQLQSLDDAAVYGQLTYALPPEHSVHLGVRLDRNSLIDASDISLRGGYAGTFGPLTAKALFSQAILTPGVFDVVLAGQQGNFSVRPEKLQTVDAGVALALDRLAFSLDGYFLDSRDVLLGGANLPKRQTVAADAGAQLLFPPVRAWAHYTRVFSNLRTDLDGVERPERDIAANKVWAGVTFSREPVTATVLGRWVGARDTVESNPIRTVPSYLTLDASASVRRVFYDALSVGFRVANVLGTRHAHPGTDLANAGSAPAVYTDQGYRGSQGYNNSLHPQPGRAFFLTLGLDL